MALLKILTWIINEPNENSTFLNIKQDWDYGIEVTVSENRSKCEINVLGWPAMYQKMYEIKGAELATTFYVNISQ
jgi:hypothetical protein